ncbi:hypothetical protein [Collimonas sp.]|jgi:hypothetical protein|uniref:hypothetical protein n=1 Tax=Collimonas sp. TaxID=1963772 RepID=UPI002BF9AED3|nr:hypothetical protein [Collimonas sp.]HWX02385.1 hypothetical protein [Collimonas sp.]
MKIQASISGYGMAPATVYSFYEAESDILLVSKETAFRTDRFSDAILIGGVGLAERDCLFTDVDFMDAIEEFFIRANGKTLMIDDKAARCDPRQKLEPDGMSDTGKRLYRVSPDITCGQVAVLATAWYVKKALGIGNVMVMQDWFLNVDQGGFVTI